MGDADCEKLHLIPQHGSDHKGEKYYANASAL